ncbi:hypothetical protein M9435_006957 [Picochlorum sp. BPE23]|nr:hypothetical protein M9435_006957 [Picochlorum sp. BPE23]
MRDFRAEYACAEGDGTSKCRDTREEEWTMHRVLQQKVEKLESRLNSLVQACVNPAMSSNDDRSVLGHVDDNLREKCSASETSAISEFWTERDGRITWERYALMEEIEIARLREENMKLGLLNETLALENKELSRRILHIAFDEGGEEKESLNMHRTPTVAEYTDHKTPEKTEPAAKNLASEDWQID